MPMTPTELHSRSPREQEMMDYITEVMNDPERARTNERWKERKELLTSLVKELELIRAQEGSKL